MTPEARNTTDAYYKAAESWANDRQESLQASRRVAWIIAIVAVVLVLIEALVLLLLVPLKTIVPYTLLVDRQTGFVQALKPLDSSRIAPDAALTQSFLVQYVIARENFDFATVRSDYRKVALWSAGSAREDYLAGIQISNPGSPLVSLPRSTIIETRVRSVSALNDHTAMVRFETIRRDRDGAPQPDSAWVAIISYSFSDKPMSLDDRFINPLGFTVTRYRRNAESLPLPSNDHSPATPTAAFSSAGLHNGAQP